MRHFIAMLIGWLFNGLLWLWVVVPKAMDWVGRSTLPDDWRQLMDERLPQWAGWLFSTPWWVPALLATALTIWLMWASWPRQQNTLSVSADHAPRAINTVVHANHSVSTATVDAHATQTKEEEDATIALMTFFWDYIRPAVCAQRQLQAAMIRTLQGNDILIDFAIAGLKAKEPAVSLFWGSFGHVAEAFSSSPAEILPLDEVISHMRIMEVHYQYFRDQADVIAQKTGINYRKDYANEWEEWRKTHNALKSTYDEQIKRSKRFGPLFRPARESWWGDIIPPQAESSDTQSP
jgi:hypothetical protein